VDSLNRYTKMITDSGKTYRWYFPDGAPSSSETSTSPDAAPSDAWGSSAMLYAFLEGLVGVEDRLSLFQNVQLSPRWASAGVEEAEVQVEYGCSGAHLGYSYRQQGDRIFIDVHADQSEILLHVLLPQDCKAVSVRAGGKDTDFNNILIKNSPYVDFGIDVLGEVSIKIQLQKNGRAL